MEVIRATSPATAFVVVLPPIHLLSQFAALSHALTTQSMAVEHENMLKREWCTEINQQVHTQDDLKRNTKHKLALNFLLSFTEISLHRLNCRRPWRPSTEGWKKNPPSWIYSSALTFFLWRERISDFLPSTLTQQRWTLFTLTHAKCRHSGIKKIPHFLSCVFIARIIIN